MYYIFRDRLFSSYVHYHLYIAWNLSYTFKITSHVLYMYSMYWINLWHDRWMKLDQCRTEWWWQAIYLKHTLNSNSPRYDLNIFIAQITIRIGHSKVAIWALHLPGIERNICLQAYFSRCTWWSQSSFILREASLISVIFRSCSPSKSFRNCSICVNHQSTHVIRLTVNTL